MIKALLGKDLDHVGLDREKWDKELASKSVDQWMQKKPELEKGIPYDLRRQIWPVLIGNQALVTEKLYTSLLSRVQQAERADDPFFAKTLKTIDTDLNRTYNQLGCFKPKTGFLHQTLRNILAAFAFLRPDLAYVQGMSFLVAFLLLMLGGSEILAF
jgi:hypothetical protein